MRNNITCNLPAIDPGVYESFIFDCIAEVARTHQLSEIDIEASLDHEQLYEAFGIGYARQLRVELSEYFPNANIYPDFHSITSEGRVSIVLSKNDAELWVGEGDNLQARIEEWMDRSRFASRVLKASRYSIICTIEDLVDFDSFEEEDV